MSTGQQIRPCARCDEIVAETEKQRRATQFEMLAELLRVVEEVRGLDTCYESLSKTVIKEVSEGGHPVDIIQKILTQTKQPAVSEDGYRVPDFTESLVDVVNDYRASLSENLEAIMYRELCTRYGKTVPKKPR